MTGGPVRITSEIGRLRCVVIHTPGREIESMTPRTAAEVLYHDIIPLSVVSGEHAVLKQLLECFAVVHEVTDLLATALGEADWRAQLVADLCRELPACRRRDELLELPPAALVSTLVTGLETGRTTLHDTLYGLQHDLPPLANLYFMRDSSFVLGDRVAVGAMAHAVRTAEAMLLRTVYTSGVLPNGGTIFDGVEQRERRDVRLEGGDVLVIRPDLIVVGISERTSAGAVDDLAACIVSATGEPVTVIAAVLPHERSTIHLDMVFTLVDEETALVFEPLVVGPRPLDVYRMDLVPGRPGAIRACDGLLPALAQARAAVRPIPCGGHDPVVREREQWLSAANVFAVAPGMVIGYDCNTATAEAFSNAGFEVCPAADIIEGRRKVVVGDRLLIGMPGVNLARGGGGPRCMTLPVQRDPLS